MATDPRILAALDNPNARRFLDLINEAEGGPRYDQTYRYQPILNFDDHPRTVIRGAGSGPDSTAAGRYQILSRTWDGAAKRQGLTDFSPRSQDIAALDLINQRGALDDVLAGDFEAAVQKTNREWASLPGSPYGQPTRTMEWVRERAPDRAPLATAMNPPAIHSQPVVPSAPSWLAGLTAATQDEAAPPLVAGAPAGTTPQLFEAPAARPTVQAGYSMWQPDPELDPMNTWADELLGQAITDDADLARANAAAALRGGATLPTLALPRALEREINRLVARL